MPADTDPPSTQEIELKLALPHSDLADLVARLHKAAPLARRKPTSQHLCNVYYDTPDHSLRERRIALRVREVVHGKTSRWVQTLKTGGGSASALSVRGEWEQPVPGKDLSRSALESTPWGEIDPQGDIFTSLAPCFITNFERTTWTVRGKDQSVIEVALDIGQIHSGHLEAPICELELELRQGTAAALFDLAQALAKTVAVLPASVSKAERGYALAEGTLERPQRALPADLPQNTSVIDAAQCVMREMFFQFNRNLDILQSSDNAEVVHQARIGWRRFKSAMHLFKPVLVQEHVPGLAPLQPLLASLGHLRDLDVAVTETLPLMAAHYGAADPGTAGKNRKLHWDQLSCALLASAQLQRQAVRAALQDPAIGAALLTLARYIEELPGTEAAHPKSLTRALKPWAERRLEKLNDQWEQAMAIAMDGESQHRARILSKRLRYGVETLQALLPKRRAKRWLKRAMAAQGSIGFGRDIHRAYLLAEVAGAEPALVEFLRGYAQGYTQHHPG